MASHELADGGVAAKVTPSEDGGDEPKPSGVPTPEGHGDCDGFVFAENTVLGYEAVTGDADFSSPAGVQVVQPVGVGSPTRADHDLAGVLVVREDHRHHVVRLTGLPTDVYEHEERPAEHPALAAPIKPQWHPQYRQREPTRRGAKAEQRPLPVAIGVRRDDGPFHLDHPSLVGNRRRRST